MPNITIPRHDTRCALCRKEEADKTGSHLAPNFLIHGAFSFDGKGNRDREVVEHHFVNRLDGAYTYYAPQVPPERIEKAMGRSMTDEEIEANQAPLKYDNLFCSDCEKRFSVVESEYADFYKGVKKSISPRIAYLFWLSVIWRMGVGRMSFFLDLEDEFAMRTILDDNLSLSLLDMVTSTADLGAFSYVSWRADSVRPEDACIFGSRTEHQPYMALLNDTALLLYSQQPEDENFTYGSINITITQLNSWNRDLSIGKVDRIWMVKLKDYLVDQSWEFYDPHREEALLIVREHERTNNKKFDSEGLKMAVQARRLASDSSVYFQPILRLRKFRKIGAAFFKQKDMESKGIPYDPYNDDEFSLFPEDFTKYYYNLANLASAGYDISDYPFVEEARKAVSKDYFNRTIENPLLPKYLEAITLLVDKPKKKVIVKLKKKKRRKHKNPKR